MFCAALEAALVGLLADEDLDELYQCSDVAVAHYAARVVGAKGANAREAS